MYQEENMKSIITTLLLTLAINANAAPFSGSKIPSGVYMIACDGSPRITITFDDGTPGVWFPAKDELSDTFLSVALTAKTTNSEIFFMGVDDTSTPYCIGAGNARSVHIIAIQ